MIYTIIYSCNVYYIYDINLISRLYTHALYNIYISTMYMIYNIYISTMYMIYNIYISTMYMIYNIYISTMYMIYNIYISTMYMIYNIYIYTTHTAYIIYSRALKLFGHSRVFILTIMIYVKRIIFSNDCISKRLKDRKLKLFS